MANCCDDSHCVEFAAIIKNEIFFQVKDPAYEDDAFIREKCRTCRIQNTNQQYLVLEMDETEKLKFLHLTVDKMTSGAGSVLIRTFRNMDISSGRVPITLQILFEGKTWTLWCLDDGGSKTVCPRLQDPPEQIESSKHEALFFLKISQWPRYRVESSMWPNFFLSFEGEPPEPVKLVLKQTDDDDDESSDLVVTDIKKCSQ